MENPNTHGPVEKAVREVLDEIDQERVKALMSGEFICGLSAERRIANKLRERKLVAGIGDVILTKEQRDAILDSADEALRKLERRATENG